ncbi:hypothetical protein BC629DRAFT_1296163, partial [Irpex lacteus]
SRRKALKVVELKEILSKAQVSLTGKANKADLIAKILASPEALAVAEGPTNETPSVTAAPTTQPEPVTSAPPANGPPTSQKTDVTPNVSTVPPPNPPPSSDPVVEKDDKPTEDASAPATEEEDPELARRKARAARFGIPLVEPTKPKTSTKQQPQNKRAPKLATAEVSEQKPEVLASRAQRFGIKNTEAAEKKSAPAGRGSKRAAPASESVDPEEAERRRKRAERFGLNKT